MATRILTAARNSTSRRGAGSSLLSFLLPIVLAGAVIGVSGCIERQTRSGKAGSSAGAKGDSRGSLTATAKAPASTEPDPLDLLSERLNESAGGASSAHGRMRSEFENTAKGAAPGISPADEWDVSGSKGSHSRISASKRDSSKAHPDADDDADEFGSEYDLKSDAKEDPTKAALSDTSKDRPKDPALEKGKTAPVILVNCPPGMVPAGKAPPEGTSQWCEKKAPLGGGQKNGPYLRWDRNGNKILEMSFLNGKPHGTQQSFYPDGAPLEIKSFREGIAEGRWIRWGKLGEKVAEGSFLNGKKNGVFTYWTRDGVLMAQGTFRNDIRDGAWSKYFSTGEIKAKLTYRAGVKEGISETYYPNHQLASRGRYHLNKLDGHWVYFYGTGQKKAEGTFENGRRTGVWTKYRPDGQVANQRDADNRHARGGGYGTADAPPDHGSRGGFRGGGGRGRPFSGRGPGGPPAPPPGSSARPRDQSGFVAM